MKNKFEYKEALAHDYKPIQKFKVFINGLWFILKYDLSVTYKIIISTITLSLALLLRQYTNFVVLLIVTGNMVSMEIMNTCVELLCDFHKTGYDERIKVIKDVAAVASGVAIMVWLSIVFYEIYAVFVYFQ
jgi:diacylglycerol kinase